MNSDQNFPQDPNSQQESQISPSPAFSPNPTPMQDSSIQIQPNISESSMRSSIKVWIIIAIVALVLIGGGVASRFAWFDKGNFSLTNKILSSEQKLARWESFIKDIDSLLSQQKLDFDKKVDKNYVAYEFEDANNNSVDISVGRFFGYPKLINDIVKNQKSLYARNNANAEKIWVAHDINETYGLNQIVSTWKWLQIKHWHIFFVRDEITVEINADNIEIAKKLAGGIGGAIENNFEKLFIK